MAKTLVNYGNGNIVDGSSNVSIVQDFNSQGPDTIEDQLNQLLNKYKQLNPKDLQGIAEIEAVLKEIQKTPTKASGKALSKLRLGILALAKEMSLGLLVNALEKAIGL